MLMTETLTMTGTVSATRLNFRSGPTTLEQNVIKSLPKGTVVQIIEEQGEWLHVLVDGQEGFVSANFVQRVQEAPPDDGAPAVVPSVPGLPPLAGSFRFDSNRGVAPDGTRFAKKFRRGVFNFGATSIDDFVRANGARFGGLSPSRLRVMQAVSANEGKLEAINTWDNAFLTFGIFQWTAGAGTGAGELPALLQRLKEKDLGVFQTYFGQFGLDVTGVNLTADVLPTGFFTLNGTRLRTPSQKERLRNLAWAYRFWMAGHNDVVRQVQIEHALGRVDLFYRSPRSRIVNRFIGDYVSSELGVALLLDQHVNRPGHVPGTLARAVERLGSPDPTPWQDADESRLLDLYIQFRAATSMTDSTKRADTVRRAVTDGLASARRGSYLP